MAAQREGVKPHESPAANPHPHPPYPVHQPHYTPQEHPACTQMNKTLVNLKNTASSVQLDGHGVSPPTMRQGPIFLQSVKVFSTKLKVCPSTVYMAARYGCIQRKAHNHYMKKGHIYHMVSSLLSYRMSTRKSRIRATTPSQYTALSMNYFWCCCAYHF